MEPSFPGPTNPKTVTIPLKRARTGGSSPEKNYFFNKQYMTCAKIRTTPSYELYLGVVAETKQQIALKTEKTRGHSQVLFNESRALSSLRGKEDEGVKGIPKLYWYGTEEDLNVMAFELTGPTLSILLRTRNQGFTLKTVLMLADQMLKRIEYVHMKGFVHRDVKPGNFAIGLLEHSNVVYLINFESAKQYRSSKTNQHKPYAENKEMVGSATYSSVNCHLGIEPSRRDDLESLGYTLVHLYKGSLPWQNVEGSSYQEKVSKTMDKKMSIPPEMLCKGMPEAFAVYLNYCRGLKYDEKPDYRYLRDLFRKTMAEKEYAYDNVFDWVNQRISPENLIYEFKDLSISFRPNPQGDISASNVSQVLSKSKFAVLNPTISENDAFSQEEQQMSSVVPVDLSIASDPNERSFPSKTVLMPTPRDSSLRSLHLLPKGEIKRSLSSVDERVIDPREDFLSKDFLSLRRDIKTIENPSFDDEDLKYRQLGTASTMNKTVSMRIPEYENKKSRSTMYNVVFEEEDVGDPPESDTEEHEAVARQISRMTYPEVKVLEKIVTPGGNEERAEKEEEKIEPRRWRRQATGVREKNEEDVEEQNITLKGKEKDPNKNDCAMF